MNKTEIYPESWGFTIHNMSEFLSSSAHFYIYLFEIKTKLLYLINLNNLAIFELFVANLETMGPVYVLVVKKGKQYHIAPCAGKQIYNLLASTESFHKGHKKLYL